LQKKKKKKKKREAADLVTGARLARGGRVGLRGKGSAICGNTRFLFEEKKRRGGERRGEESCVLGEKKKKKSCSLYSDKGKGKNEGSKGKGGKENGILIVRRRKKGKDFPHVQILGREGGERVKYEKTLARLQGREKKREEGNFVSARKEKGREKRRGKKNISLLLYSLTKKRTTRRSQLSRKKRGEKASKEGESIQ